MNSKKLSMSESHVKVFVSTANHFKQLSEHLEDPDKHGQLIHFCTLQEFFFKLGNVAKDIDKTCAQVAMAFTTSPPPNVKESQELLNGLEAITNTIVAVFLTLPKEQGQHLYKDVHTVVKSIIKSLIDFTQCLKIKGSKGNKEKLKNAAMVFAACDEVQKLPKNNLESTLKVVHNEELLLLDAVEEIYEEVKNDKTAQKNYEEIDNSETWSNQDRELLPPCTGLVKTAKSCLKQLKVSMGLRGDPRNSQNNAELDSVTATVAELSPAIDSFVSAIYPPMNRKVVKKSALEVVNVIQSLLHQVQTCHFIKGEEDKKWVSFLLHAVDHNNNKLQPLLSPERAPSNSESSSNGEVDDDNVEDDDDEYEDIDDEEEEDEED